jgi:hypothetical protein
MKNIFLHAQFCASQKKIYFLPDNFIVFSLLLVEAVIHCSRTAPHKILKHKNACTGVKISNRAYVDIRILTKMTGVIF